MRICAYCWLPNHWHFVTWPEHDGDLSQFMQRMTNMHTQRWQRAKCRVGYGHLYQGRFKSFPVESDEHFYAVVRYVERNAPARPARRASRRLAVGKPASTGTQGRRAAAGPLALARAVRLDRARQHSANGGRTPGDPPIRPSWQPVRQCVLDRAHREATGARIDPSRSRPPSQRIVVIRQNAQFTQYMRLSPLTLLPPL